MALKKPKCGGKNILKLWSKLAETILRSAELSIAYSPCYSIVLMCYNEWCYAFGFACTTVSIKHLTNCKTDV